MLQRFNFLADGSGLFFGIPSGGNDNLGIVGVGRIGEQGFAKPSLIVRDQVARSAQNVSGGTVIALKANDLRAGEVFLKPQNVVDFRAAPTIDRLVVIADATYVGLRQAIRLGAR